MKGKSVQSDCEFNPALAPALVAAHFGKRSKGFRAKDKQDCGEEEGKKKKKK